MKWDVEFFVDVFELLVEILWVSTLVNVVTQHENELPGMVLVEGQHLTGDQLLVAAARTAVANHGECKCLLTEDRSGCSQQQSKEENQSSSHTNTSRESAPWNPAEAFKWTMVPITGEHSVCQPYRTS